MIPQLQNDYYKYSRLFKGNYLKGATLFRSLLNDASAAAQIIQSVPALGAVFTDFYKSEANKLCYDVLAESAYFEQAMMAYFRGVGATVHETFDDLLADTQNIIDILRHVDFDQILQQNQNIISRALLEPNVFKALILDENSDIVLRADKLRTFSEILNPTGANIYTAYNTYWTSLIATTTPFDSGLIFYQNSMHTSRSIISEEANTIFVPSMVSGRISTSSSTYYYYPAVFKYDIISQTWTLLYVASGDVRQTSFVNNSRSANGVAYDPDNDNLYIFYRPSSTTAVNQCDIVKGANGSVVQTGIQVGNIGLNTLMTPFFCTFDMDTQLAKYVWKTGDMSVGSGSTYGWLHGCSVSENGLVWSGKVAHPTAEYTPYFSSYMNEITPDAKYRFPKGALVGAFQTGGTINTSLGVMVAIQSSGELMKANYRSFFTGTSYVHLSAPTNCVIGENGFAVLTWDMIGWGSTNQPVAAAFSLEENEIKLLKSYVQTNTSYKYSLYSFPPFNKAAVQTSQSGAPFIVMGLYNGSVLDKEFNEMFSAFNSSLIPARGSERYKLDTSVSNVWTLYDYMPEVSL